MPLTANDKKVEVAIPAWAKVLPLVGLAAGGYYAYHGKGNVGKIILFATIGAWAASAPAFYIGIEGMKGAVSDSLTEKKNN